MLAVAIEASTGARSWRPDTRGVLDGAESEELNADHDVDARQVEQRGCKQLKVRFPVAAVLDAGELAARVHELVARIA